MTIPSHSQLSHSWKIGTATHLGAPPRAHSLHSRHYQLLSNSFIHQSINSPRSPPLTSSIHQNPQTGFNIPMPSHFISMQCNNSIIKHHTCRDQKIPHPFNTFRNPIFQSNTIKICRPVYLSIHPSITIPTLPQSAVPCSAVYAGHDFCTFHQVRIVIKYTTHVSEVAREDFQESGFPILLH